MDLLKHVKRLEEFFELVDPPRRSRARELLLTLTSEEELFSLLEEEYGEFFQYSPPVCKYGKECYRKNPVHFNEYAHPWLEK